LFDQFYLSQKNISSRGVDFIWLEVVYGHQRPSKINTPRLIVGRQDSRRNYQGSCKARKRRIVSVCLFISRWGIL